MSDQSGLTIILICVILSAFFSATETAFNSVNKIRLKSMADKNPRARLVLQLLDHYDNLLSTILIGNNIVNILATSVATVLCVAKFGEEMGSGISTLITTILLLLFGEISPKTIAKSSADRLAMFSAPFLKFLMAVFKPFNLLFGLWQKMLGLVFKATDDESVTDEEILTIVKEAEKEGGIDNQESFLIHNSIDFNETEAEDIMTPRVDMEAISSELGNEEVAKIFGETGFSRLPVYEEDIDDIIGIIYQKDFYNKIYTTKQNIKDIIRPVIFVTPHKPIGELLRELQRKKMHVAIIIDEYGGTVGMLTIEDIIEELVGEIWDEHEEVVQDIQKISENEYIINGSANLDKVFETLHYEEEEEPESLTVNGWILDHMMTMPKVGDVVTIGPNVIKVLEVGDRRVTRVRLTVKRDPVEEK